MLLLLRDRCLQKRRERINERLRTLQSLVPNGTKVKTPTSEYYSLNLCARSQKSNESRLWIVDVTQVDLSTMLEEAVEYVKFLHLQIKVTLHVLPYLV